MTGVTGEAFGSILGIRRAVTLAFDLQAALQANRLSAKGFTLARGCLCNTPVPFTQRVSMLTL